jgi:hypothetical protein
MWAEAVEPRLFSLDFLWICRTLGELETPYWCACNIACATVQLEITACNQ